MNEPTSADSAAENAIMLPPTALDVIRYVPSVCLSVRLYVCVSESVSRITEIGEGFVLFAIFRIAGTSDEVVKF